jgi:hypothetical protein
LEGTIEPFRSCQVEGEATLLVPGGQGRRRHLAVPRLIAATQILFAEVTVRRQTQEGVMVGGERGIAIWRSFVSPLCGVTCGGRRWPEFAQVHFPDYISSLGNHPMFLGCHECGPASSFFESDLSEDVPSLRRAEREDVGAATARNVGYTDFPTLAQVQGDRVVCLSRQYEDRDFQLVEIMLETNDIPCSQAEVLGCLRTDQSGVVPHQFGNRIGQFLKPGVVKITAIVEGIVRMESDFQGVPLRRRRKGRRQSSLDI